MNGKDFYKILGVDRKASEKDIKKAYRRLARKYHPDVNPGDKVAETRFKEISEAYDTLSDSKKRLEYDQFGEVAFRQPPPGSPRGGYTSGYGGQPGPDIGQGFDFGDLFENLIGRRGKGAGRQRPQQRPAQDVTYPLELSLREAYSGTTRVLNLNVPETCPTCGGRGAQPQGLKTCESCKGTGQPNNRRGFFTLGDVCDECGGRGEIITKPCPNCHGAGSVQKPRRLDVRIPAGVAEGQKIRAAGQGPSGGDIYLVAQLRPDSFFTRKDDDLHCEVPITFTEAALGAEIEVPTLNGSVKVRVPAETSSGRSLRLTGLGFPHLKSSGNGDLYVKLRIVVPRHLSAEEKSLIEQLSRMRSENPRTAH